MIKVYPISMDGKGAYDGMVFELACGDLYLHGKLEDDNGYDLCLIENCPDADGIYNCEVMMNNGTDIRKAKLFYWVFSKNGYDKPRGLVVQVDDTEHLRSAQWKYEQKCEFI